MKKSCKIFSAVALSAVLAMGTAMPAFADNPDDLKTGNATNATNYEKGQLDTGGMDGAHTQVNIATYSSKYSVTVPLYAPFMLDTAGGVGVAPTNYYIDNESEAELFVTKIEWKMNETASWTFGSATDPNKNGSSSAAAMAVVNRTSTGSAPTYGSFVIKMTPSNENMGQAVETTSTTDTAKDSTGDPKTVWTLAFDKEATNDRDEGINKIDLTIYGSKLAKSLTQTQKDVASIMYTVSSRAIDPVEATPGA